MFFISMVFVLKTVALEFGSSYVEEHDVLKLSTKGRYGLRAMAELAGRCNGEPVLLDDLSEAQHIPKKYLYALFGALKNAGLIRSTRGAGGGYMLTRPAGQITVLDVVTALEGPLDLVECVGHPEQCGQHAHCPTAVLWADLSKMIQDYLGGMTLLDVIPKDADDRESG